MYQPSKNSVREYTSTIMEFGGLNKRVRGSENEFFDMVNMSSRDYPLLSTRKKRTTVYETENEIVFFIPGSVWGEWDGTYTRFYVGNNEVEALRSTASGNRQVVQMGAYVVIFPDKKYINTTDITDCGSLETKIDIGEFDNGIFRAYPCTIDGEIINGTSSSTAPENPAGGDIWFDTSGETSVHKKWDSATKQWLQFGTTYVRIDGVFFDETLLSKWDVVSINGIATDYSDMTLLKQVSALNAEGVILFEAKTNYIVIAGLLDGECELLSCGTIERKVPIMDHIVECNNRLWGCKYGMVNGKFVNEIYACRQGDFKNWYAYLGVSSDSYAVSVGAPGNFTAAAVLNKNPVFFKEDCIIQIYGSTPASFQVMQTVCEGVESGDATKPAVCNCNNMLFYKGPTGFFAFSGSLPQRISRPIDNLERWDSPYCCAVGEKIYMACITKDNQNIGEIYRDIFVYDLYSETWHKEDSRLVKGMTRKGDVLYMTVKENGVTKIESFSEKYNITQVPRKEGYSPVAEEKISNWAVESVDIGYSDINMKYIGKMNIRVKMSKGATYRAYISVDGEEFEKVGESVSSMGVRSEKITFTPRRCEFFRYRIEGEGEVSIISISKTMIQGSDKP